MQISRWSIRVLAVFQAAAVLSLSACHDAPRENPLDPQLTPPVELSVALDDTAGIAALAWTQYNGEQPFTAYWVLRNQSERTRVDTLARLSQVTDTAYLDTLPEPGTGYEYRVAVVSAGGLEVPSQTKTVRGYEVSGVRFLEVTADSLVGSLTLRWSQYHGAAFGEYWVTRRQVGTDLEEVLASGIGRLDTALVDTTALAGVDYLYRVTTFAAGQAWESNTVEGRLSLPAVAITRADFDSRTATATLTWTRYRGPRFLAYRVLRRTPGLIAAVAAEIGDSTVTALSDSGLIGDTRYTYQVQVVTSSGEIVEGQEADGTFHQLLEQWPLDLEADEWVRLYSEPGNRIATLISSLDQVRLRLSDPHGRLLGEQVLLADAGRMLLPASAATVLLPDGRRLLSGSFTDSTVCLLVFDEGGQLLHFERSPFADFCATPLEGAAAQVRSTTMLATNREGATGYFDSVTIARGDELLYTETFDSGPPVGWRMASTMGNVTQGPAWQVSDGALQVKIISQSEVPNLPIASMLDSTGKGGRVEATLGFTSGGSVPRPYGSLGVGIGAPIPADQAYSSFWLYLSLVRQQVLLQWVFSPPRETGLARSDRLLMEPAAVVPGTPYRLGLGVEDGRVSAVLKTPVFWSGPRDLRSEHCTLARVGDLPVLTAGIYSYTIDMASGGRLSSPRYEVPVTELRDWQDERGRNWLGVCLHQKNQILLAQAQTSGGQVLFPGTYTPRLLGQGAGQQPGYLLLPISFDIGPDGRFYVLDAGNSRVQVFRPDRTYLTQWGRSGQAAGAFSLASPSQNEAFGGSLVVDDEGFVYVADLGNQRIQKFAP